MSNITHNCCQSLASVDSKLEAVDSNLRELWMGTKSDIGSIANLKELSTRIASISSYVQEIEQMVYDMTPYEIMETPQSPLAKAMNKKLPPMTPTRRVKPTVCPPAPARKGKYKAGNNKFAALASSDSDSSTLVISPEVIPQATADNGRRSRRPCPPGCCAPPTPRIPLDDEETLSLPGFYGYQTSLTPDGTTLYWIQATQEVPDEIDLDDYDMFGRPFSLFK